MILEAARATAAETAAHLTGGRGIAVLPFGALEQHARASEERRPFLGVAARPAPAPVPGAGPPHLPLSTDTVIAAAAARGIADALDALLLPAIPYGETWLTAGYPGTVSLAPDTVTAIAVDIGRSIAASGASALVIVNGDFGNRTPLHSAVRLLGDDAVAAIVLDLPGLDAAATELRSTRSCSTSRPSRCAAPCQQADGPGAGARRGDRDPDPVYPHFPSDFGTRQMQLHPFSPTGVFGDPRPATARKGAALLDSVIAESLRVLADFLPAAS